MTSTDLTDPIEFDRAYDDHAPAMLTAATRVLRDRAAAEDVVQDVFVALWRKPSTYDPRRGPLGSYLTMMARSRALDRWRSRSSREAAVERSAVQVRTERPQQEDAAAPGKGLTAREIAKAAGVPLGTAKSRVRLGLAKARAELASAAA